MSQAAEILTELQRRGVIVAVEGDTLCLKPRNALDDGLLARIREAKPAILEALRNRLATCSPDCYELEPGVWIHRPHTGCTTIKPEASGSQQEVAMTCWHCRGEKRCACIACWQAGPGECVICEGRGQVWRWVQ
jgi:TubC N-terminal docking domain